jgi:hypothetical protein
MKTEDLERGTQIGEIENYYGGLHIKKENDKFWWAIENYTGFNWEEIPEYLYNALMRFHKE